MTRTIRPEVTVGLPVFDGRPFVERALRSLLDQATPFDFEVVVADNASTDDTVEVVRDLAAGDPRVVVVTSDENRGAAWNYNRTLALARAPWFTWHAADDLVGPGYLAALHAIITADPGVVVAYPRTSVIDDDDAVVADFHDGLHLEEPEPHRRLAHLLASRTEYHPVFGLAPTAVLRACGAIGPHFGSDVSLLAALALRGRFHEHPERLFLRRFHEATSVKANPGAEERAAWFDPANRGRRIMPVTDLTRVLLAEVRRAPLPAAERARCADAVLRRWLAPRARVAGGEWKQRLRPAA